MTTKSKVFAVTGATGNTGSKLTELLLEQGKEVRAIARGRERLQALTKKGAVAHAGSLEDVHFLANALKGADGVFIILPPNYTADHVQKYHQSLSDAAVEAIRQAEVPRVVALSSFGAHLPAGAGPISGLHYLEERLGSLKDVDVLCLRAGFFMENFLQNIEMIKHRGINGSPLAPDRAEPMIATRDISAAAAQHLTEGDFSGKEVRYLLGARDVTFKEATRVLGEAIGRPDLKYVQFSYEDTRKSLLGAGLSKSVAESFVEMYKALNEGRVKPTEARSPKNTTPTSLEEWSRTFTMAYGAHARAKSA